MNHVSVEVESTLFDFPPQNNFDAGVLVVVVQEKKKMWSSYSVTDRPPVTGTANGNSSDSVAGRGGGGEESGGDHVINGGTDSADPLLGLVALQLTVLVFISALGTFANALVFAVFYRRPSLRTISNRSVK